MRLEELIKNLSIALENRNYIQLRYGSDSLEFLPHVLYRETTTAKDILGGYAVEKGQYFKRLLDIRLILSFKNLGSKFTFNDKCLRILPDTNFEVFCIASE